MMGKIYWFSSFFCLYSKISFLISLLLLFYSDDSYPFAVFVDISIDNLYCNNALPLKRMPLLEIIRWLSFIRG